jgi:hypothetical protein
MHTDRMIADVAVIRINKVLQISLPGPEGRVAIEKGIEK